MRLQLCRHDLPLLIVQLPHAHPFDVLDNQIGCTVILKTRMQVGQWNVGVLCQELYACAFV